MTTSRQIAPIDVIPNADHPGYKAGIWYLPSSIQPGVAGGVPGTGSIRLFPAYIKDAVTLNALGVRITTTSASGNIQAAIYANDPTQSPMRPTGLPLTSTASMSTTTAAPVNASASGSFQPGIYWFATNSDNATSACVSLNTTNTSMAELIGTATQANLLAGGATTLIGLSTPSTFGTWPDLTSATFTESTGSNAFPIVEMKFASVP